MLCVFKLSVCVFFYLGYYNVQSPESTAPLNIWSTSKWRGCLILKRCPLAINIPYTLLLLSERENLGFLSIPPEGNRCTFPSCYCYSTCLGPYKLPLFLLTCGQGYDSLRTLGLLNISKCCPWLDRNHSPHYRFQQGFPHFLSNGTRMSGSSTVTCLCLFLHVH